MTPMRPASRSLVALVALLTITACGGAVPPAAPRDVVVRATGPDRSAPAEPRRGASDLLKKAWSIESPKVVAYADFRGLVRTPLMKGLANNLVAIVGATGATPAQKKCVEDFLGNVQELALGSDGNELLVLVRVDPAATKWVAPCLLGVFPTSAPTTIAGASEAWTNKSDVTAVSTQGLVLLGVRGSVERGLAGGNSGANLAAVTLGEGEYIAWSATMFDEQRPAKGTLLATDTQFRVAAEADLPSETLGQRIETELDPRSLVATLLSTGLKGDEAESVKRLVGGIEVKRSGRHIAVALDLREPPEAQARDLGIAAALGIYGVRRYISNAKQAEARNVVGQLAKSVVADWEAERPDSKPLAKKKLVSYGPVPKTVPRGVKYQSTDADWKPWYPLRFSMTLPQYFQYEIKAAKDGESAEIIARGDLNGDGKTSRFRLLLKVERPSNEVRISPSIEETDPDE